jgi:hypothetical protein
MALQFTRNAKVYIELTDGASSPSSVQAWELSVLDGFSFSQSINSSEITINEAGSTSRRARLLFNDSLAPVEWSLSTYARPFVSGATVRAPEEALMAMFLGADTYTAGVFSRNGFAPGPAINVQTTALQANGPEYQITDVGTSVNWTEIGAELGNLNEKFYYNGTAVTGTGGTATETKNINTLVLDAGVSGAGQEIQGNENIFNMSKSNVSSLSDSWNIYFGFEDGTNIQYYRLDSSVVNSMSVDFDIDGIATISWSGFARALADAGTSKPAVLNTPISGGLTTTTNFIRNRVSTVSLKRTDVSPDDTYNLVLTGGNFTIENNINYLTPEELGVVNGPLANITGARSVSGSMTCYLDNDQAASKSGELFADLVSDTATIRNVFDLGLNIGGVAAGTPRLVFDLPTAHVEIPTINVEDLLTLEVNFHGQVKAGDVDNTNEARIIYKA